MASAGKQPIDQEAAGTAPVARPSPWARFESKILLTTATGFMLLATAIMLFEATGRGFFDHSYFWAEEAVRYLMVWAFFLTIGCAGRAGHMIRTEMFVERLPPALQRIANVITTALGLLFSCILLYASVPQVIRYYTMGMMTESTLDLPMWLMFLAMPIGGALAALYYAGAVLTALRGGAPYAPLEQDVTAQDTTKGPLL
ncbi:MAG: TRAP transporter small permease [Pseudodonghicola sp.]